MSAPAITPKVSYQGYSIRFALVRRTNFGRYATDWNKFSQDPCEALYPLDPTDEALVTLIFSKHTTLWDMQMRLAEALWAREWPDGRPEPFRTKAKCINYAAHVIRIACGLAS
jgi:hypothetical protein